MIEVSYLYDEDWGECGVVALNTWRRLPHKKSKLSGKWKEIDGIIYVGILERHFFKWIEKFVCENNFRFTEVQEFTCE